MKPPKLERTHPHEINAWSADRFFLWESPFDVNKQNLTIEDPNGLKVITIYGITKDQLVTLAREIQLTLGTPPEQMIHQLRAIHDALGKLIPTEGDVFEEPSSSAVDC